MTTAVPKQVTAGASPLTHSPLPWVLGCGALSALIWWHFFADAFPLGQYYAQGHVDYAWITQYRPEGSLTFMAALGALFGLAWIAQQRLQGETSLDALGVVLGGHVAFSAVLRGMYPAAAVDIYDYYLYGRISLLHGGNPFTQPPRAFPEDPYLYLSPWQAEPSVYGPIWQILSLIPTALAGNDLLLAIGLFKVTAILGSLITSVLIYVTLKYLAPERAIAGTLFFAWNPLVLFETAGNGHNDSVMTAFMMLGVYALLVGPRWAALPGLAAAVLTKVPSVLLGPLLLAGVLRSDRWPRAVRVAGIGIAISLLLAIVTYAPFWQGLPTLSFLGRGHWFTASPATILRELLRQQGMEFEAANQSATLISAALFGLVYVVSLMLYWRSVDSSAPRSSTPHQVADMTPGAGAPRITHHSSLITLHWLRAAYRVTMAYLVIAALWWHAWYLIMLICFAALLGDKRLEMRCNLFCFGGLLSYVVFKYVWWYWEPTGDYFRIMLVSVIAIFSLPALHWLTSFLDQFERIDESARHTHRG
ncbi:MAG: hypothetical protein ACKVVP_04520 [Chloroflexota bacterium]